MAKLQQQEKSQDLIYKLTDDDIKNFEKELEDFKQSTLFEGAEGNQELSFYGRPLRNQTDFNGYVVNDSLGACHYSVVAYCLKNGIVKRHANGDFVWLVAYEDSFNEKGQKDGLRLLDCPYKTFIEKWKGLKDLKDRRHFAEDKESEGLGFGEKDRIRKILDEQKPNIGRIFSENKSPEEVLKNIEQKSFEKEEFKEEELGF